MNYSTYRFTLDIHKTKSQVSIPVLFQDTGTQFYINLTDGGKPYHISDGCKATLYGKKPKQNPDGTYDALLEECEVIDGGTRIRYEFSDQTTTQLGSVACEIRLYSADGKLLTTPAFEILVEARVIEDDEIIESGDERTALDRIFESEAAREEAEKAREEAERARDAEFEEQKEAFNAALLNKALLLNSEEEQTVDSNVKFNNSVSIEGDLSVKGKHYVVEANSLFVKDKFIACNFLEADKEEPGVRGTAGFLMIAGAMEYNELGETEYPAYGIVYNYYKDAVFLGKGRVNYIGHFKEQEGQYYVDFYFDEGEAQAIATRSDTIPNGNLIKWDAEQNKMVDAGVSPDDIGGVSIEDIVQVNTKTGNLVQWDATQKKLVDTGFKPAVGASGNTVVVRNENGTIFANGGVGSRKALMNVEGVQKALSLRSVDSFTSNTGSYIYNDGQFRAKGWVGNDTYSGQITDLPTDNDWAQRIINASDSDKFLWLRGALKHDNNIYYSDHVFFCTDKATLDSVNTRNGDLAINIKANSSIYINSIYTEKSAMRIYIT